MVQLAGTVLGLIGVFSGLLTLQNGSFKDISDGKPVGWQCTGQYKILPNGGVNNKPAVELTCSGPGKSSHLLQIVRPKSELKGSVRVTAWFKCIKVEDGGDCSLWLDTILKDGGAIWGKLGVPDRNSSKWQKVSAIVTSENPIKEIQIFLLLRNVKGKVLVSDVRMDDTPLEINEIKVNKADDTTYDLYGALSGPADWTISAKSGKREIYTKSGNGKFLLERFTLEQGTKASSVVLSATLKGRTVSKSTKPATHNHKGTVAWWTADSTLRVFQNDLPPATAGKSVVLNAARNDRESFQVCLKPLNGMLKNVRISTSDLKGTNGTIEADNIEWSRVGYVWISQPFEHLFSPRKSADWWPDPLLPALDLFDIEKAVTQPLWVTVNTPKNAVPGKYEGSISISADGIEPVTVPIALNVYPAVIPDQGGMKTAFALMDCYLRKVYGNITPELRRNYTDFLLARHLNPDDISRSDTPDIDELEYANKHGLNAFNVLNAVEECKDPYGWVCYSPLEAYTPEFTQQFLKRMEPAMAELEKRGLADKAYVYGFDERGPEFLPIIRDLFKAIKEKYPKIRTLSTAWLPDKANPMDYNIDWYVPLTSKYDPEIASLVRKQGGEVWWYICMGPNYPYANWLVENPLIESRVIWWSAYQYNVEGFLYWGLNIWIRQNNEKVIANNAGPKIDWSITTGGDYQYLNGDGVLLYPGENGPIGSTRLEVIRDGLEDFELLRQYKEQFGEKASVKVLSKVTKGISSYTRDKKTLDSARLTMLKAIK